MRLLSTVVKFIGLGPALLSSVASASAAAINEPVGSPTAEFNHAAAINKPVGSPTTRFLPGVTFPPVPDYFAGEIKASINASGAGVYGHVLIGYDPSDYGEIFVATNATNFPQGVTNGSLSVDISDTDECNSDALDRALEFQLEDPVTFEINDFGMIEGTEGGWFQQPIREIQGNSTLPVSLTELVTGSGSEYGLAVYLQSSDDELLGCASLEDKSLSEEANEYDELLDGLRQDQNQDQEAVKEAPSSGSKIGLLVSAFAIAAVGIAFVMGDVFAL